MLIILSASVLFLLLVHRVFRPQFMDDIASACCVFRYSSMTTEVAAAIRATMRRSNRSKLMVEPLSHAVSKLRF